MASSRKAKGAAGPFLAPTHAGRHPEQRRPKFTVSLEVGKTQLRTWFCDKGGKELCGAFYVRARRG